MNKTVVVYKSKYGSTKKYAQWITGEVNADLFECSEINSKELIKYDNIVYGGGLYAGGIAGISIITKNYEMLKNKNIVVFTVGLASTDKKEIFYPVLEKNFSKEMRDNIKFFHLRGAIDYKKLGLVHKSMMGMLKTVTSKKDSKKLSNDERDFLDTYGKKVDFTDKSTIVPLVNFIISEE